MGLISAENVVTYVSMTILFIINLLNYIDRYTIVGEHYLELYVNIVRTLLGVLPELKNGTQNGFHEYLSDTRVAFLQTGFIISYMCFSPIFGYLGDRFSRKHLMGLGVILWSSFTAASSFAPVSYI